MQPNNALSPIGQAVAIAGKFMRTGDLQASDSLSQIRTWVRIPLLCMDHVPAGVAVPDMLGACSHANCLDCEPSAWAFRFGLHADVQCSLWPPRMQQSC